MLLSPRKNDLTSLFKEVRVFKGFGSFETIFGLESYFHFLRVIFKEPAKNAFNTSIKITSRGYFDWIFEVVFCPMRLFPKKGFQRGGFARGGIFYSQLEPFLLTVELLCLQSVEGLFRHTFPLRAKKLEL